MIGCICADGTYVPPSIIYQASSGNLQDTWLDDFNSEEHTCHFASSASGWTNEDLGYSWLVNVFDRYTKRKARNGRDWRCLYVDGHGSHLNMRFLNYCADHRIFVVIYPPHSTHRLQPLDVGCFGPLASYYSTNLAQWLQDTQGLCSMSKREFFSIFWPSFLRAMTEKNIQGAFKKTGLVPFNPDVVLGIITLKTVDLPPSGSLSRPGSSRSALSDEDWRKLRELVKEAVSSKDNSTIKKLENTVISLHTQLAIVKAENNGLRKAVTTEKRRRKRGKGLFEDMREEGDGHALFFSPSKIQVARDKQAAKERQLHDEAVIKEREKIAKRLKKEEEARLIQQRKGAREIARLVKEQEREKKQREKEQVKADKAAEKQLQEEAKQARIASRKTPQKSKRKKSLVVVLKVRFNEGDTVWDEISE